MGTVVSRFYAVLAWHGSDRGSRSIGIGGREIVVTILDFQMCNKCVYLDG